MSLCPECGSPWSGTLSCPECAKRQQPNAHDGWVCGNCGKENRGDRDHCWSCASPKDSGFKIASQKVGVKVATASFVSSEPEFSINTSMDEDANTNERTYKS